MYLVPLCHWIKGFGPLTRAQFLGLWWYSFAEHRFRRCQQLGLVGLTCCRYYNILIRCRQLCSTRWRIRENQYQLCNYGLLCSTSRTFAVGHGLVCLFLVGWRVRTCSLFQQLLWHDEATVLDEFGGNWSMSDAWFQLRQLSGEYIHPYIICIYICLYMFILHRLWMIVTDTPHDIHNQRPPIFE
jgi:hypothetical protein